MSLRNLFSTAFCTLAMAMTAEAGTIATWTFETSVPSTAGPITPEVGSGTGTSVHATPGTFSNPSGNGSNESWNSNSWAVGDYYQFQVSTPSQSGIEFSWDQTRSSAGPGASNTTDPNFRLQYSTDGANFTDVVDYLVPVVSWNSTTADASTQFSQNLSSISALNNQPDVYFRLAAILAPQNSGGQSRVDNVSVTAIPEPASAGLLLVGLLVAGARCAGFRKQIHQS